MVKVNFEEMEYYDSLDWKHIEFPTIANLSTINFDDYFSIIKTVYYNYEIPNHLKLDITDNKSLSEDLDSYGQREGIDKDKLRKVYLKRLLEATERILIIDLDI